MTSKHRSNPGSGSGPARYPGSFLLAFRKAIADMGWTITRWLGDAVECVDAKGRQQMIGLENLFRRARQADRAAWPELICDFLQTGQKAPIDNPPDDLNLVADQLLCRLGPPMHLPSEGPAVWQQSIESTGLFISLVIDFDRSMFYVTKDMVEKSGQAGEIWLQRALENLRKLTPAESFTVIHEESGLRQSSVGDSYDSSRVLLLDELIQKCNEHGHLAALPGRDELLVMPVTAESLQVLPRLKEVAGETFRKTPYPISDEVYWIKDGRWQAFMIEVKDKQVDIQPPEQFVPILEELLPGIQPGAEPSADG